MPGEEITDAGLYSVSGQRMIGIKVRDQQGLITRMTPLRRFFMRANHRVGYPVVNIPQTAVADDLDDVVAAMRRFRPDLEYGVFD